MRPRAVRLVAAVCAVVGACSGPASGGVAALHVRDSRYLVPGGVAGSPRGRLLAARAVPGRDPTLGSARRWEILYESRDVAGRGIAVSGLVLVPRGVQPHGGWRAVAWAHGTTGLADRCAPSLAADLGHDASAVREVRSLLAHGFAVVATDYPGLGTPGVHPYLVGHANAAAVVDAVTAAHQLLPGRITRAWATVGHSEGGETALFTAQDAARIAPQWPYVGTVALAPASTLEALVPLAQATADPVEQAYALYAVAGLGVVDPAVHLSSLVAPAARRFLPDLATGCVDDVTNDLTAHPVGHVFVGDPVAMSRVSAELGRDDDPDRARWNAPTLVLQGLADEDVPAPATAAMVGRLCRLGVPLEYRTYPGLDHEGVVTSSLDAVARWVADRFAGVPFDTTCPGPGPG
ncbi:MAG TPA: lipase family protein [Acidimicrobiia bacterium]|nr:lipase family protein [Acidimicrobiia bacterium]